MFCKFRLFYQFLDEGTGSIASMHKCRADYQRDKWTFHVSITVYKANSIKQMSQMRTPCQSKPCFGKRQFLRRRESRKHDPLTIYIAIIS